MKTVTKLSLIAATLAAITSSSALADDPQLQNRLAMQRANLERDQKTTTVALYVGRHSFGQRSALPQERTETRFVLRTNANGQQFGLFVPVR